MKFDYDAFGQRIAKHIYSIGTSPTWEKSIYYVRDAQGNIMATYEHKNVSGGVSYKVNERPMYGSSRIGVDITPAEFLLIDGVEPPIEGLVPFGSPPPPPPPPPTTQTVTPDALGNKLYELNNHLGNVISVVSGAKFPVGTAGNPILSYNARIVSYNDYLPFGSTMTGRTFSSEKYRFGFNGQEKDNEIKGTGNSIDFGEKIYDPRLGKFLSIDFLTKQYPFYSPYQFAGNDVIRSIDLDGLEPEQKIYGNDKIIPVFTVPASSTIQVQIHPGGLDYLNKNITTESPTAKENISKTIKQVGDFGRKLDNTLMGHSDQSNNGGELGGRKGFLKTADAMNDVGSSMQSIGAAAKNPIIGGIGTGLSIGSDVMKTMDDFHQNNPAKYDNLKVRTGAAVVGKLLDKLPDSDNKGLDDATKVVLNKGVDEVKDELVKEK